MTHSKCNDEQSTNNIDLILQKISTDKSTPEWAAILISCIRGLLGEVKGRTDVSKKVEELESARLEQEEVIKALQGDVAYLKAKLKETDETLGKVTHAEVSNDSQEQYSHGNCLVVHGVNESTVDNIEKKVYDIMIKDLGLEDIRVKDAYRIGRYKAEHKQNIKTRPILLYFGTHHCKKLVFNAKRKLKGKGVMITEYLTQRRQKLLRAAIDKIGRGKVWTHDGQVTTKIEEETIVLDSFEKLESLHVEY